jgi:hypothetical protein
MGEDFSESVGEDISEQAGAIISESVGGFPRNQQKLPLITIRGVESDPEKDERRVWVIGRGFCSTYPTNGTMHAQPHRFRKILSDASLFFFQSRRKLTG